MTSWALYSTNWYKNPDVYVLTISVFNSNINNFKTFDQKNVISSSDVTFRRDSNISKSAEFANRN